MAALNGMSSVAASTAGTASSASPKAPASNALGKDTFLKLLVAQLQNQDPMKPMDDTQFIAQLSQFNTLEQMQQMNDSFKTLMSAEQLTLGSSLIGKTVEAMDPISQTAFGGVVTQVKVVGGVPKLTVGTKTVDLKDITQVR